MYGANVAADITTALAVESNFKNSGLMDPFSCELAGKFADCYIFAKQLRFTRPQKDGEENGLPHLLRYLAERDAGSIDDNPKEVADFPLPDDEKFNFEESVVSIKNWAMARCNATQTQNLNNVKSWLSFQGTSYIAASNQSRIGKNGPLVAPMLLDYAHEAILDACNQTGLTIDEFVYFADNVIRGYTYVECTQPGQLLLFHPLRVSVDQHYANHLPNEIHADDSSYGVRKGVEEMVRRGLPFEDYCNFLLEMRYQAQKGEWGKLDKENLAVAIMEAKEKLFPGYPTKWNPDGRPYIRAFADGFMENACGVLGSGVIGAAVGFLASSQLESVGPLMGSATGTLIGGAAKPTWQFLQARLKIDFQDHLLPNMASEGKTAREVQSNYVEGIRKEKQFEKFLRERSVITYLD